MLTLKRLLFTLIAICIIALPISLLTIAAENTTPNCDVCTSRCSACPNTHAPMTITTSDGTEITITDADQAHKEWTPLSKTLV